MLKRPGLLVFTLALGTRIAYILITKSYLTIERAELVRVASSLASRGAFADAFGATGATAHVSPLYPLLLACVYRIAGDNAQLYQEVLASILTAAGFAFLPTLAAAGGLPRAAGISAGLIGAANPLRLWIETKGSWESPLSALLLILLALGVLQRWQWPRTGTVVGLTLLTSPSAGLWAVGHLLTRCFSVARRQAALSAMLGALILSPWVIRNAIVFGAFIPFRSNLGLELSLANSAAPIRSNADLLGAGARSRHPAGDVTERQRLVEIGEVAYNAGRMSEAQSWIASHPAEFLRLTLDRIASFWFPPNPVAWKRLLYSIVTLCGALGWGLASRSRPPIGWLVLQYWLIFPLVYYLLQADARYSYPLHWTYLLGCGALVSHLWRRVGHDATVDSGRGSPIPEPARLTF